MPHVKEKILEEGVFQIVDVVEKFSQDAIQRCNHEKYRHGFPMFSTLVSCHDWRHR